MCAQGRLLTVAVTHAQCWGSALQRSPHFKVLRQRGLEDLKPASTTRNQR